MKLIVATPISLAVSAEDVGYVRAEDETGAFGIPLVDPKSAARPGKVGTDRIEDWEIVRLQEATGRNNLVALEVRGDWVKNMDPPFRLGGRIVIDHEEIKEYMAPMVMGYAVAPPALLEGLKKGEKVRFTIDADKRVIVGIKPLTE